MSSRYLVLSTGFAMFAMFFGSGNLVFPVAVGAEAGSGWAVASLGFLVSGVCVPFLGVFAILLCGGCTQNFFGILGKKAHFWLSLLMLSLMGPFGVLARCITVAHGAVHLVVPEISLPFFGVLFCGAIFALTLHKGHIVPVLGSLLTPLLLLCLAAMTMVGIYEAPATHLSQASAQELLHAGFMKGYQTMDLLAAFFFSAFIVNHLKRHVGECPKTSLLPLFLKTAAVGGGLLALVYTALTALAGFYAYSLHGVPEEEMLGRIAQLTLGPYAGVILCAAVSLACFTTGVVLATLYAHFLQNEVMPKTWGELPPLLVTLAIAFGVSTLEFSGIAAFIAPILETIYPALILFSMVVVAQKLRTHALRVYES